jgi:glycosyltransferase involved in cell wall biosynthesis
MKISYGITVCDEKNEIKRLLDFLIENIRNEDEIIILFDEKNGDIDLLDYLLSFNKLNNVQTWRRYGWNNNFADWKNKLNEHCTGDFILQLDADEMISKELIDLLPTLIESNEDTDMYFFPRINIVEGITNEHIVKWGWNVDDQNRINHPDYQGRLYKNGLKWEGRVHEKIVGYKYFSLLPKNEKYSILHHKHINKQIKQNNFYSKL